MWIYEIEMTIQAEMPVKKTFMNVKKPEINISVQTLI